MEISINPDCMDEADLERAAFTLETLGLYCKLKRRAMQARRKGRIQDARDTEHILDALYYGIPAELRW